MSEVAPYGIVLSTCPDRDTAARLASLLVEQRLAACVNVVPGIRSFYWWQEQVESDEELLLIVKTHSTRYPQVEQAIRANHPYELPEVVYVPLDTGLSDYMKWLASSVDVTP